MRLNLPECNLNIKKNGDTYSVFDILRRKFVALTPEEFVRQSFVNYLIHHKGFPLELMGNEISLNQNGIKRRCDTLVANRNGEPVVIVEYKAPSIEISQAVFDQIVRYNMVLHASYLIVSNGISHFCCKINYSNNTYEFLKGIPDYATITNA